MWRNSLSPVRPDSRPSTEVRHLSVRKIDFCHLSSQDVGVAHISSHPGDW